ncbi:hypothetical protein FRX31_029146, partial [Thalictrum thalictroides]
MKLAWSLSLEGPWADYMNTKYKSRDGSWIAYHRSSALWPSLRKTINTMKPNVGWMIGDGQKIDIWRDAWAGEDSVQDKLQNLNWQNFKSKLCDVISNRNWDLPDSVHEIFHRVGIDLSRVMQPSGEEDYKIWKPDKLGVFSVKSAFNIIRKKEQKVW